MPQIPNSKEDITWTEFKCDVCKMSTHIMDGEEPYCGECRYREAERKRFEEEHKKISKDFDMMLPKTEVLSSKDVLGGTVSVVCMEDKAPEKILSPGIDEPKYIDVHCIYECQDNNSNVTREECASLGCNICLSKTLNDDILYPTHYNMGSIQPIDAIESWDLDFRLANVIKYVARAGKKDKNDRKKDLLKAQWYLLRFIEKEFNDE